MSTITIIDADYATLVYYPEKKIIHHTFHSPMGGQPLRDLLNKGTDTLQQNGGTKWLSDDRKNSEIPQEDSQWAMEYWAQKTINAGWKYWAIIVPDAIEARASMTEFIEDFFRKGLRISLFSSVDEAMRWLESMP